MEMKTIYMILTILFFIAACGSIFNLLLSWNTTNAGQKVGIVASGLINVFFGLLIYKYSTNMPDMSFMNPKEYNEVFDMENIKIDVNKKGKLKVKGGAK